MMLYSQDKLWLWTLRLLALPVVVPESPTFARLCDKPAQAGIGKLLSPTKCQVVYPRETANKAAAEEFCTGVAPYSVSSSQSGSETTCVFEKGYNCDDHEEELYDHCFVVVEKKGVDFNPDACPEGYSLHVLESKDEFKYITTFFDRYKKLYVANSGDNAAWLHPEVLQRKRRREAHKGEERPIYVRLTGRFRGKAYYGPLKNTPYLCSRTAVPYEETYAELDEIMQKLGFTTVVVKNKQGNKRTFVNFGTVHAVESEEFKPDFAKLHDMCSMLPDGYTASQEDFESAEEYKKVLEKLGPMWMRSTVGRSNLFMLKPDPSCKKDQLFSKNRKQWSYVDNTKKHYDVKSDMWCQAYPDNMCADTSRITALMSDCGYTDAPSIARRPIICGTGGSASTAEKRRGSVRKGESCNRGATFNKVKGHCECDNPSADGRNLYPQKFGNYPPGVICLDCQKSAEKRSIVFLLDSTGSVEQEGWDKQLQFMHNLVKNVRNIRTGIVKIIEIPVVGLEMGDHTPAHLSKWIEDNKKYEASFTLVGYAIYLARQMLKKENTKHRMMILFSDGDEDICLADQKYWLDEDYEPTTDTPCEKEWKLMNKHKQLAEAKAARAEGIKIIYVAVGPKVDRSNTTSYNENCMDNVIDLAGGVKNVVEAGNMQNLDMGIMHEVVKTVCDPNY
ncbi:unnamed protein product [Cylicocyclus nassatus]|uniref:VWFA domain-containing protein n=1 Tax=Cylicocyclus nassatus TaxID=53992 RepID=A0AA36M4J1_CYLNA|nr:unnamed protein product [Cylicocyclus nassatus]